MSKSDKKKIPSENISKEVNPESVIHDSGKFVCETEVLKCPNCENEGPVDGDKKCSKCKVERKLAHILHNAITGKWKSSSTCTKKGGN